MHEGIGRGPTPSLEVLVISSNTPTRLPSDLLPYIPRFRHLFAELPQTVSQMSLKTIKVPVNEIECVARTVVKVRGAICYLRIRSGIDFYCRPIVETY